MSFSIDILKDTLSELEMYQFVEQTKLPKKEYEEKVADLKKTIKALESNNFNDFIHNVSERNIAIGDYVWYNERIHKVQKIRFDDEFWKGKEIAIIDIQAKDTKDVPTRALRYVR